MLVPLGIVVSPPGAREAVRGEGDARLGREPALEDVRRDGTSSVWGSDRSVRALKYDTGPSWRDVQGCKGSEGEGGQGKEEGTG